MDPANRSSAGTRDKLSEWFTGDAGEGGKLLQIAPLPPSAGSEGELSDVNEDTDPLTRAEVDALVY